MKAIIKVSRLTRNDNFNNDGNANNSQTQMKLIISDDKANKISRLTLDENLNDDDNIQVHIRR